MNKLMLIEILKNVIFLSLKEEITLETYQEIISSTPKIEVDDNLIAYKETELLFNLFQSIPYYQVSTFLENLLEKLYKLKKQTNTTSLLDGIINSLYPSIKARMATEFNAHIYELIKTFYQNPHLNREKIIKRLKRNLYSPEHLTGWDIATYEQLHFYKEEKLRERISRTNYYRKAKSEDIILSYMTKYFSSIEKVEEFLSYVGNFFSSFDLSEEDLQLLKEGLTEQLNIAYQKFLKIPLEADKKTDENQLTLQFF